MAYVPCTRVYDPCSCYAVFFNVLMWGVVVSCTAAANDFSKLLATRFFLGIFEATVGELIYFVFDRLSSS